MRFLPGKLRIESFDMISVEGDVVSLLHCEGEKGEGSGWRMARSRWQKRGKDWIPGLNGISVFRCFGKEDTEEARSFSRQGRDQDDKEWKGFPIPAAS